MGCPLFLCPWSVTYLSHTLRPMCARSHSHTNPDSLLFAGGVARLQLQMDPTFFLFTNDYFSFLPRGETWLLSDVRLAEDPLTAASMRAAAVNWLFKFGVAWTKLSNLLPDPATPGEVRPTCRCPKQATLGQCQTARGLAKY